MSDEKKASLDDVLMDIVNRLPEDSIKLTVQRGSIEVSFDPYPSRLPCIERVGASFDVEGAAVFAAIARDIILAKWRDRRRLCRSEIGDTLLVWPENPPRGGGEWRYVRGSEEPDTIGRFHMSSDYRHTVATHELEFIVRINRVMVVLKKDSFSDGHRFERMMEEDEL